MSLRLFKQPPIFGLPGVHYIKKMTPRKVIYQMIYNTTTHNKHNDVQILDFYDFHFYTRSNQLNDTTSNSARNEYFVIIYLNRSLCFKESRQWAFDILFSKTCL